MGKKDNTGLNQFNVKESLDLTYLSGETSESSGQLGNKRKVRPVAVGALAVAVAVGVSAVVIGVTNAGVNARSVRNTADHQTSEAADNALGRGVLSQTTTIYAGASSNTEVLTELSEGTDLLILGVYGEYYRISDAAGQLKGFVHKDYVDTGGIEFAAHQDFTPIVEGDEAPVTKATTKKKTTTKKKIALKGISFEVSKASITVGQSVVTGVTYNPENATNKKCSWTVSDSGIAGIEVSEDGTLCRITGIKAGSAVITAKSVDGGYTASFTLTVKAAATTTATTKPSQNTSSDEPTDPTSQETDPTETTGSTTEQSSEPAPSENGASENQNGESPVTD